MSKCDTCKVEMSIRNSNEPVCCKWYMDNVVIGGVSVDRCTAYEPVGKVTRVRSKLCPDLSGYILKWLDTNQFTAMIVHRNGTRGEMICHTDYWEVITV